MSAKALPSPEVIRQLLRYEPETGKLFWLPRDAVWFQKTDGRSALHAAANWNAHYADREAFTSKDRHGYLRGSVLGIGYFAHRLCWTLQHGVVPVGQIDHINGTASDNRACNLRIAPQCENMKNLKRLRNNTSGQMGVTWRKTEGKWAARITVSGQTIALGHYALFDDAVLARKAAETRHGFHANHGRVHP
jgi:HNH endonuclease